MSKPVTAEMVQAHGVLMEFVATVPKFVNPTGLEQRLVEAIMTLDDADFFVPITDARDEAEELKAYERRRRCGCGGAGIHGVDHED